MQYDKNSSVAVALDDRVFPIGRKKNSLRLSVATWKCCSATGFAWEARSSQDFVPNSVRLHPILRCPPRCWRVCPPSRGLVPSLSSIFSFMVFDRVSALSASLSPSSVPSLSPTCLPDLPAFLRVCLSCFPSWGVGLILPFSLTVNC